MVIRKTRKISAKFIVVIVVILIIVVVHVGQLRAKINTRSSLASRGQSCDSFDDGFYLRVARENCPCRALYPCKLIVIGRYVSANGPRSCRVKIAADFYSGVWCDGPLTHKCSATNVLRSGDCILLNVAITRDITNTLSCIFRHLYFDDYCIRGILNNERIWWISHVSKKA